MAFVGNVIDCEGGRVVVPSYFAATAYDKSGTVVKEFKGGDRHMQNFIDVVRSRKREDQLAEVEEGAISTMLIHLANISYRTGRTLYFDPVTYTCKGDPEATAMFTRAEYRTPFTVPNVGATSTAAAG